MHAIIASCVCLEDPEFILHTAALLSDSNKKNDPASACPMLQQLARLPATPSLQYLPLFSLAFGHCNWNH